jgi:hypothetical protein
MLTKKIKFQQASISFSSHAAATSAHNPLISSSLTHFFMQLTLGTKFNPPFLSPFSPELVIQA